MKNMRRILFLLLLMSAFGSLHAVGGLSASKLLVPSADTLDPGLFDFEVAFGYNRSRSYYNEWGHLKNLGGDYDQINPETGMPVERESESETGLDFRMTAGIVKNFEIGFGFGHSTVENSVSGESSSGFGDLAIGMKYSLMKPEDTFRIAVQGGVNMEPVHWTPTYEGGLIATIQLSDKLSIDADVAFSNSGPKAIEGQRVREYGISGNVGIGYEFEKIMPVFELGYSQVYTNQKRNYVIGHDAELLLGLPSDYEIDVNGPLGVDPALKIQERVKVWEKLLTATIGFTYGINDISGVALMISQDISGVNAGAGRTISGVYTLTLDGK